MLALISANLKKGVTQFSKKKNIILFPFIFFFLNLQQNHYIVKAVSYQIYITIFKSLFNFSRTVVTILFIKLMKLSDVLIVLCSHDLLHYCSFPQNAGQLPRRVPLLHVGSFLLQLPDQQHGPINALHRGSLYP